MFSRRRLPEIHLVLTDDWELRGDGSGNMRAIQFDTMRGLCDVYERHGFRGSFNVELMQQLAHLEQAARHPELGALASEWDSAVQEAYRRGHDIQLHLHPQWTRAEYEGGSWRLDGAWSLTAYDADEIKSMLRRSRTYLEQLLRPIDPDYRCLTYRSGSWCIAPSDAALTALAEEGVVVDMSIVDGAHYENPRVSVDYRSIDEPFLPFYPDMRDARRLADRPQPIVCVPTHSFSGWNGLRHGRMRSSGQRRPLPSAPFVLGAGTAQMARRLRLPASEHIVRKFTHAPSSTAIPDAQYRATYSSDVWTNAGTAAPEMTISDLAGLSHGHTREMLRDIRRRARASGHDVVPVILINHTKDIGDFEPIERFCADVEAAADLRVIRVSEMVSNLEQGVYPIRVASAA
jgi:hypothetical protein